MKRLVPLLALALTGCVRIPVGSVEEYHRVTSVLGVTSQADLTGIHSENNTLKAQTAVFTLTFPGFSHTQTVKGLVLTKP